MKWLKHHTDSHASLKVRKLLRNYGLEGYGFYWICNELVAFEGKNYKINKDKDWETTLAELSNFKPEKSKEILEFLAEEKFIDKKSLNRGHLHIPKMKDYADDYTKKALKMSGQTTDNVPLKEKKEEEIKRNKKKTDKKRDIPFLIKKIGNGIDQDNIVESLDVLGITELTDSQILVVEDWLKLFPSRDYKYHALKCKTWWKEKGKTWTRPISAFGNWLEKTKADEHVIKKKSDAYEAGKQKARQVEAEKYTDLPPEKKAELESRLQALKGSMNVPSKSL